MQFNRMLSGIRVVDFSLTLPGPFASQMLADMGASVLKIEPPGGDLVRRVPEVGGEAFYQTLNAGKSVVQINLKEVPNCILVQRLVARADVLIEGFRPGTMARYGLDFERVRAVNPGIVYCALSGYGQDGGMAPGHDSNFLAEAGALFRGDASPAIPSLPLADFAGALFASNSVLAALFARQASGEGCHIDVALADAPYPLLLRALLEASRPEGHNPNTGVVDGGAAFYNIYRLHDGRHAVIGAIEPAFWRNFCDRVGRPDWIARQGDPLPQRALINEVRAFFETLTRGTCERMFAHTDACVSVVRSADEALRMVKERRPGLVVGGGSDPLQVLFPAMIDGRFPSVRQPLETLSVDALSGLWELPST